MQNIHSTALQTAIMPILSSSRALNNLKVLMSSLNIESAVIEKGDFGAKITNLKVKDDFDVTCKANVLAFVSIANQYLAHYMPSPLLASKVKASAGKKKQNISDFLNDIKACGDFMSALNRYIDADLLMVYFEYTGLDNSLPLPGIVETCFINIPISALGDACNDIKTNIIPKARQLAAQ
jgi:hypothetical protein